MKKVEIYTDGSCLGNPGIGGYGAVLVYKGKEKEISGGMLQTTNNRMEMTALIEALSLLKEPCDITITSDSKYVIEAIEKGWAKKWQQNNWIKSDKKPALNSDLWQILLTLIENHKVKFVWIKGHNGHTYNERCDLLATQYSSMLKEKHKYRL